MSLEDFDDALTVLRPHRHSELELVHGASPTRAIPWHMHDGYQVIVVGGGTSLLTTRAGAEAIGPNDVTIVRPLECHSCAPRERADGVFYALEIAPSLLREVAAEIFDGEPDRAQREPVVVHSDAALADEARALCANVVDSSAPVEAEHAVARFLGRVLVRPGRRPHAVPVGRENAAVQRAREYLEAHCVEPVSLAQLSRVAGLSRFHLVRSFRAHTGMPPHAFLNQARMRRAKAMLRSAMSISQIAMDLGFTDQSHFTRRFKQAMGITPGAYRARIVTRG